MGVIPLYINRTYLKDEERKEEMTKVRCPRCGYCWDYRGHRREGVISCPRCKTTMSLSLARRRARGVPLTKDWRKPKWY